MGCALDEKERGLVTTPRFYVREPIGLLDRVELDEEQTKKLRRVLRARPGDRLTLFDGSGLEVSGPLKGFEGSNAIVEIDERSHPTREPGVDLTVGMALIKADRFELAVQKLTEVGASRIVPIEAERSVIVLRDERAWERRRIRIERIIADAAEQSERVTLPQLCDPMPLEDFLTDFDAIVLVERLDARPLTAASLGSKAAIAIGPEGGWSERERELIESRAKSQVTLGSLILRSETAAIVAAGALVQRWLEDSQEGR